MFRHRLRVAEAMAWLTLARVLIRFVAFHRWRATLGTPLEAMPRPASGDPARALPCARAVRRAAIRLPEAVCLPQAMALQWMLARRQVGSVLVMGVVPGRLAGTLHDLHAWVESGGEPVLGDSGGQHVPVIRLAKPGVNLAPA